jgi:excisionase family DNA binding protein
MLRLHPGDLPVLLTYPEVSRHLGVSLSQVKRLVRGGSLPAVTVGKGSRRIRRADLLQYVDSLASSS